ncbi:hypothetical protein L1049_007389 [Liquidambar formosana]|uniref:GH18 domain-containing protein n=1 Tax=Liquidambar formosana TaxID=63359 RepID=A0AAP0N9I2_LIQFO
MATKTITLFLPLLHLNLHCSSAQTWIRSGYWFSGSEFPISDIHSTLFTHLNCAFANLNSTYQLSISSDEQHFSAFTNIVKQKNPSIVTLLSIGGGNANYTVYSSMVSQASYRNSFIESSIKTTRLYGFHGLDLSWGSPSTSSDMTNLGTLLDEWRAAVNSESANSNKSRLILTMAARYYPTDSVSYPVGSIRRNLNWVHVMAYDYNMPTIENNTGANAALYDPLSGRNTDFGISEWMARGLLGSQLVLSLPYYGYAWTLVNPNDNAIGAPAAGPAFSPDGSMTYKQIKDHIQQYGGTSVYNATYVVNYCTIESTWIVFDDVEAISTKVSYAMEKGLLGYTAWHIANDDNWVLSQAAFSPNETMVTTQEDVKHNQNKKLLLVILLPIAIAVILVGSMMCFLRRRALRSKEKESQSKLGGNIEATDNAPNLQVFSFANIVAVTNNFSIENKL